MNNTILRKINGVNANKLSLTYEFSPNPMPIIASPSEKNHEKVIISLVITNSSKTDVILKSILISLPIGDKSTDLTYSMEDNISIYTESLEYKIEKNNTANSIYIVNKDEKKDPFVEDDLKNFKDLTVKGKESIFLVITCDKVSTLTGDFAITVQENSYNEEKDENVETFSKYFFPKLPYGFYLNSFRAEPPIVSYCKDSSCENEKGYKTNLYWNGARSNRIKYYICSNLKINEDKSIDYNKDEEWIEMPSNFYEIKGLKETSVYSLKAEYKTLDGIKVEYYLQTVIFVINSDINATNIIAEKIEIKRNEKIEEKNCPSEITIITPGKIEIKEVEEKSNSSKITMLTTEKIDVKDMKIENTLYVDTIKSKVKSSKKGDNNG